MLDENSCKAVKIVMKQVIPPQVVDIDWTLARSHNERFYRRNFVSVNRRP